ncbi:hypothetical protein [Corynebacterium dentalis]|uniref:hypothetical protein n=1 Tax=Corynebacterium dentalis TaxID=2014528 RepID=UPI002899CD9D|nr:MULTISPECIES: hypothetical protein [Actinomycetes]
MNRTKLGRDLEKAVQQAARAGLDEHLKKTQKSLDSLARQYEGEPVSKVKPALKQMLSRSGMSLPDRQLTEYAEKISEGTRITLQLK